MDKAGWVDQAILVDYLKDVEIRLLWVVVEELMLLLVLLVVVRSSVVVLEMRSIEVVVVVRLEKGFALAYNPEALGMRLVVVEEDRRSLLFVWEAVMLVLEEDDNDLVLVLVLGMHLRQDEQLLEMERQQVSRVLQLVR